MMTHPYPVADYYPIEMLVARQPLTNVHVHVHVHYSTPASDHPSKVTSETSSVNKMLIC